jgi:hypothetical protein
VTRPSSPSRALLAVLGAGLATACGPDAGEADTELLFPYDQLRGGVVFASQAFAGSAGYDLYWAPAPLASTTQVQPVVRLTEANGNEWQPSVSAGFTQGVPSGIAFARPSAGIFLISPGGRISQVSDTRDTPFRDWLPAVSPDGAKVAWVREDTTRPIGQTGFFETSVMIASFDGSDAQVINARPGVVQHAPVFDPDARLTRLAWSEFDVASLGPDGPTAYGIWVHDWRADSGFYLCSSPAQVIAGAAFRCFGQHLAWPISTALVLPQSFMELYTDGTPPTTVLFDLLDALSTQQLGQPVTDGNPGFFDAFPLSVSYQGLERMIFDGVVTSMNGDEPTLAFFIAAVDGSEVWRLETGLRELDGQATSGFFYSVATPQLIP